ncbi:hypothetical protein [Mesorhizobium delmotii]|nr:hypothetical protein [Mesorhizobium delmotii]
MNVCDTWSKQSSELETVLSECLVEDIVVHAIWPVTRSLTPKVGAASTP